ncbi:tetraspanin-16 isoform X2 [Hyla sarda]|uniref:tetraspanin-16 isoform X2 n=1 Tax=Hyla sarda TaxID=327740 RepID=UPI0024C23CD9|nr:tetraspanin-16 isoform X2 [Hyla sarda]
MCKSADMYVYGKLWRRKKFFGLVLVGLGLWTRYSTDSMVNTLGSQSVHFRNLSLFCIAAGTVMCILGFLGCFGALKKNRSLLLIFLLIMLLLFISEMVAAALLLGFTDVAESIVKDKGLQFLKESYYESNDKGLVDEGLDSVMQKFNCCGFFGYEDFVNSTFSMKTGLKYPKPCCKDPELSVCNGLTTSDQVIYTKGCFLAILEQVKKNSMALGIAAAVITGWELSSIIIALMLFVKLG